TRRRKKKRCKKKMRMPVDRRGHDREAERALAHISATASARGQRVLVFLEKFVLGHFLLDHIGELDDEVHNLLFKNRRPHACERVGVILIVVPHFPLAPWILPRP